MANVAYEWRLSEHKDCPIPEAVETERLSGLALSRSYLGHAGACGLVVPTLLSLSTKSPRPLETIDYNISHQWLVSFLFVTSLCPESQQLSIMMISSQSCFRLSNSCFITTRRFSRTIRIPGMDIAEPFEEETLPWYKPEQFYPVHIGKTLNSAFKVLGKLGYGAYSTSWLCRNLKCAIPKGSPGLLADPPNRNQDYVTIKVCTLEAARSRRLQRELQFYEHVSSIDSKHVGTAFIRPLFEVFEIGTPAGQHLCFVHPPMHMTVRELQYKNPSHRLSEPLMKWILLNTFRAFSFLHDEAHVVHTGMNLFSVTSFSS